MTDRENVAAPIAACGALTAMLALQLLLPIETASPTTPGLAARRTRPVAPPALIDYPSVLARPLFAPDRRPGPPGADPVSGVPAMATVAALGSATGRGVATAVVSSAGGQTQTLKLGDELNGWRLVQITRDRLVFENGAARHALIIGAPPEALTLPSGPGAAK